MKKIALVLIILAFFLAGCVQEQPQEQGVIKIGVIAPLTGPAAEYGVATQKALLLAEKQVNDAGGINGKRIELFFEDDECEPAKAITAFNKLAKVDGIRIIAGTVCSSVTLALAPLAEENSVLLISSGSSNPRISCAGDYIFRTWPSDALQGKFLAQFVEENFQGKSVAIIYMNNDYGAGLKGAFEENFSGKIVSAESFEQGATDFRAQLAKTAEAKPDIIFLASYAKEIGRILKQSEELGINAQFIGGEGTKDQSVLDAAGNAAEGIIGTIPHAENSAAREKFISDFNKEYGTEPGITADAAYDIIGLLKVAIGKCGSADSTECLKNALYAIKNYDGASGKISFDGKGDVQKTYDLITVKQGQFVPYESG